MSLSIQYESLEEAEMRLNGTVVLYDGEPVQINRITAAAPGDPKPDVFRVYAEPLPIKHGGKDEEFRKFISSKKFDLSTIPLGFINYKRQAYYAARKPARQYKQGLSRTTFSAVCPISGEGVGLNEILIQQCFVDCIKGVYPTFDEVLHLLEDKTLEARAFHRHFALGRSKDLKELLFLYYKNETVGLVFEGRLVLGRQYNCLREMLVEAGVNL